MAVSVTVVQLGKIGSSRGEISFSYLLGSGSVFISACEPADKRKSGVSVLLSSFDMKDFWKIVSELDRLCKPKRTSLSENYPSLKVDQLYEVVVNHGSVCLEQEIVENLSLILADGNDDAAIENLCSRLNWISRAGAQDIIRSLRDSSFVCRRG